MNELIKLPDLPTFEETEKIKLGIITPQTPEFEEEEKTEEEEKQEKEEIELKKIEEKKPNYLEEEEEEKEEPKEDSSLIGYVKGLLDLGVLILPENFELKDDFSEDTLREILEHDARKRDENSLASLRSQVRDERIWEIVDYAIKGGQYADINKFFEIQKQEVNFETLDISTEEGAATVVLEGLKRKGISEKRAKDMLEIIIANDELEEEAKTIKEEFLKFSKEEKARIAQRDQALNQKEIERQEKWRNDFYKSLEETKFKQEKKSQILSSFNNVRFEDGTTMPKWRYQMAVIQNNPAHFMQFLELLSLYSTEKGFSGVENKAIENKETEITNSLLEKIKKNAQGVKMGKGSHTEEDDNSRFIPSNPADRNVRIK